MNADLIYKDIFNYLDINHEGFFLGKRLIKSYEDTSNKKANLLLSTIDTHNKKIDFLFLGSKYCELISCTKNKNTSIIIGGWRQFFFSKKLGVGFHNHFKYIKYIVQAYQDNDIEKLSIILNLCIEKLKTWNPRAIIVVNDSTPLERLWILSARQCGIPTICIQHGIFKENDGGINDGKFADIFFAYDIYQADIVKKTGCNASKVFGFYRDIDPVGLKGEKNVVCILGQPYGDYYASLQDNYIDLLKKLIRNLNENKIFWKYKPHPGEKNPEKYIPKSLIYFKKSLQDIFEIHDIFISFTSTALLEATLNNKIAIQIKDTILSNIDFSYFGYAHTLCIENISESLFDIIYTTQPLPIPLNTAPLIDRFNILIDELEI